MTPDLKRLGELVANLPPMVVTESPVSATPPGGSGRLLEIKDGKFKWQPIAEKDWLALAPEDRAAIIIERAEAWLHENGDHVSAPIAFVDPSAADPSAENIFGGITSTIKDAICATYRLLHSNPGNADLAILALSMTLLTVMGLVPEPGTTGLVAKFLHELPVASPHITQAFVVNFGQRFCKDK